MTKLPAFFDAGSETDKIDVRLSYGIVRLFSEGLYASPNKAIEELVANAFDAGAQHVAVMLPADWHDQIATIAVLDDGEGMDAAGLHQHWLIGKSLKRSLETLPRGRQQIGKFGIGKLASYVLASRLTHISKRGSKFYSTSMDFAMVDARGDQEIEVKSPIRISLRELSEAEAKAALNQWTDTPGFTKSGIKLFGAGSSKAWTFAILSDLKNKVHEISPGKLEWVLRTALPLRDDFAIFLDGKKLVPSKAAKNRLVRWAIGKEIDGLARPATDIALSINSAEPITSPLHYGLSHPVIGRITGYAEAYKDLLTGGKSSELGRSHGFFVYVKGRLINVEDGHFGIPADELRHGSFGRMRIVVNMEGLDDFLQSDRERVRQGPALIAAQNVLRAIFNKLRPELEKADRGDDTGAQLARKLGGSPASLARRPIIEMVRAALAGKAKPKYVALPISATDADKALIVTNLETRAETPELFIAGVDFSWDGSTDDVIAVYDAVSGRLRVNGLHPFIGAFYDQFASKNSGLPLEVFAMAEVLLEAYLQQSGFSTTQIDDVMSARDQLLRNAASEANRMTPLMVANHLRNARNDQNGLETWVVEAFRSLGFEATKIGGKGKPDGVAEALLPPDATKKPMRFKVSLEAKSKEKDGAAVSAKSVGVSTIARQRKDFECDHAIVVGQLFPTSQGEKSALAKEIAADRSQTAAAGEPRTITLIHIEDLARLVQARPVKALTLQRIQTLLRDCSTPEQSKEWVDKLLAEKPPRHDYATIIRTIAGLQSGARSEPVQYGELRIELRHVAKIEYTDLDDLRDVCKRMAGLVPEEIEATDQAVILNQSVTNIIAKLEAATKEHLGEVT